MTNFPLLTAYANHWWVLLLRGIFAVLFGILAFAMPGLTLVALVFLFGIMMIVLSFRLRGLRQFKPVTV